MKAKKITLATIKSFVRKNENNLLIRVTSTFDGMTDCVQQIENEFEKIKKAEYKYENNLGFNGIWLVGGGRNYFSQLNTKGKIGFHVYNCCGSFDIAIEA